ncbi:hypothetical protein O3G_MSEX000507 [Manduca sexta]|nr:hypothetical protein O3G_MSEX000507 [Manduca sexta]
MSGGRSIDKERKSPRESGEDSEDESEILEESPCGRWLKRREEVRAISTRSFYYCMMVHGSALTGDQPSADSQGYHLVHK